MAADTIPAGTTPANDASRVVDRIINRQALDRLEVGSLAIEYAFALCHAVMDKLDVLRGLHGRDGVLANENTCSHIDIATTLISLQLDKLIEGKQAISDSERGWPRTDGHRL